MGFRFRRSIKLLPGIRLNFGKRGITTTIGVRGARVTFGKTGTRTTVGLPGSGISYTHLEKPHRQVLNARAAQPPTGPGASQETASRGFLWIGLIVAVIVVVIGRQTTPAPPVQMSTPPRAAQTAAQAAARSANDAKSAEAKRAALGIAQIRHAVTNSNTLRISRVTAMPNGAICYRFHLQNSRGVMYLRTAVIEGAVLKASGSDGFTALWNRRCAHQSGSRDITSEVENVVHVSTR